jgi:hypothetical protein
MRQPHHRQWYPTRWWERMAADGSERILRRLGLSPESRLSGAQAVLRRNLENAEPDSHRSANALNAVAEVSPNDGAKRGRPAPLGQAIERR